MYDSDDEEKESVGKKIESLLRHTKKDIKKGLRGLTRQGFALVSPALNINLAGQGFAPVSPPFDTKSGLKGLVITFAGQIQSKRNVVFNRTESYRLYTRPL